MPKYGERSERTADITMTIVRIINDTGLQGVTMRNVAARCRMSLGTLTGHLGTRDRMLRVCGQELGRRRVERLADAVRREGLAAFVPTEELDLLLLRAWVAWRELARDDDGVAAAVSAVDDQEQTLLERAWSQQDPQATSWEATEALWSVVLGLREEVLARGAGRLPTALAQAVLTATASAFARSSATMASGSAAE